MTLAPLGGPAMDPRTRLLVVPANLAGSVQHFYHFLFGYALPFLEHCHPLRASHRFMVRDCGPMNAIFRALPGFVFNIVPVNTVLQSVVGAHPGLGHIARITCPGFDRPPAYARDRFARIRTLMDRLYGTEIAAAGQAHPAAASERLVLLIERAPPDAFYTGTGSENPEAGASRRSIPNLDAIEATLAAAGHAVLRVRLEDLPFFTQIHLFARAWRVVGQHGAGLAHMLWAREGAGLIEIQPATTATSPHFRGICDQLGLAWRAVAQAGDHDPVDPAAILAALG